VIKVIIEDLAGDEPWWCGCPDRAGPHVHFPNWGPRPGEVRRGGMILSALVDTATGLEIPGSRR
jgi:hypothetical protein